ncbi:unnamed protein product [Rotaria sordida]|uniref:Uncharacterized protein n=1 Tax=Rotaria sordida TaxID=392033 RepID=A0A818TD25_9BILA|nr:unnamed protein product [Rotaria sordida]CAF3675759.1 unnamed protein product [Rotaria sordida]
MDANNKKSSNTQQKKKATIRIIIEVIIAIIIIIVTIILYIYWKKLIINSVLKEVALKPDSAGYKAWLNPPTTITRAYRLFNITNPTEIVTDPTMTTINVQETRPYSYLLSSTKQNIQWSNDYKSIHYSVHRLFTRHPTRFDPSSVNDKGVFIDFVRAMFRAQFPIRAAPMFYHLGGMETFYHTNAIEQLEGFTSDLFNIIRQKMTGSNTAKSGFIYRYNGSRAYNYKIKSGLMEKGQVLAFTNEDVPFTFSTENLHGTVIYDGLTSIPMLYKKPSLNIFQPDFCRPISVRYNRILSMFEGIHAHEYVMKLIDFSQCTNPSDVNTCPEVDRLDVSKCISASLPEKTIFLSKAHFYGSNDKTKKQLNIKGFTPTRDQHETLMYFEPYSGTPLRAHYRLQLNIELIIDPMIESESGSDLEPTGREGVKRLVPILWIDQEVHVNRTTINKLRMVHLALRYGQTFIIILAIILIIIIIVIIEVVARQMSKNETNERANSPESDTFLKK